MNAFLVPPSPPPYAVPTMRFAIAIFTAAAAMFVAIGANAVLEQQRVLDAARPVPGKVLDARVQESTETDPKARKTVSYRPLVRYSYTLGGVITHSSQVFPPPAVYTSKPRAERIVADHPEGKDVVVWYMPGTADKLPVSFLLREWDFTP